MADLLFLTQRFPYPPNKGEKIRQWQILQHFSRSYAVHLGCLMDDPSDVQHLPTIQAICRTSHIVPIDRRRAKIACLRGLATGDALSVTYFKDSGLAAWVRRTLTAAKPDKVFVASSNMAPYVLDHLSPNQVFIADLADVDSLKWDAYARAGRGPMAWVHAREAAKTTALERTIGERCTWCTFVSHQEAALFDELNPQFQNKTRSISNGVDHGYFDPSMVFDAPFRTDCLNFVFTGTMDYPPNIEGAVWFASAILPLIRRTVPNAQFHVVGSNPAREVQALAQQGGVFVTGRVPDVRPYLAHATAAVAPMKLARGIQNKVLEGMAMARPVILTSAALEGINAEPDRDVVVADTEESFAAACLNAAAPEAEAMGQSARQRVVARYSWPVLLRDFDALLSGANQRVIDPVP